MEGRLETGREKGFFFSLQSCKKSAPARELKSVGRCSYENARGWLLADFERGRFQPLVGFQVAWLARLIREYYPACLVPSDPQPPSPDCWKGHLPWKWEGRETGRGEEDDINSQQLHKIKCLLFFLCLSSAPADWWAAPSVITLNKPLGNGLFNVKRS